MFCDRSSSISNATFLKNDFKMIFKCKTRTALSSVLHVKIERNKPIYVTIKVLIQSLTNNVIFKIFEKYFFSFHPCH